MGLLSEIQETLLTEGSPIATSLLKLRFLASRIGSTALADWVQYEMSGYPIGVEVPKYRKTPISYTGNFIGYTNVMNNVPISPGMIAHLANKTWNELEIRDSMSIIDSKIAQHDKDAHYGINTGHLLHLIRDKIFTSHQCTHLYGVFTIDAFVRIQSAVRSKALDLTINLETDVPEAKEITLNEKVGALPAEAAEKANNVTYTTIYQGPVTQVTNSGQMGPLSVNTAAGNIESLIDGLKQAGLSETKAKELAEVAKDDPPQDEKTLGQRTRAWISTHLSGPGVALAVEAIRRYFGF